MFVVPREALPKEPVFPANLEELGYQITEADQLRSIADPSQPFRYRLNANERYNEVRKEALNECVRDIVLSRLHDLGMQELRLPLNAPPKSPHVAILISPNLSAKKRVIVVFGEPYQDLGIWAYRTIGNETVNSGSAVDFVKEALSQGKGKGDKDEDGPGLVIANLGQLVWHCRGERAVSLPTWDALPRKTAVDPPLKMTARNYVPGNETWQDHVDYVFENVLGKLLAKDAKIDIIGVAEGGHGALNYLSQNC
ncbi:hypothetical protein KEM55_008610 [Ascosphaera atra]|nr:hypothetical protein KEM55_008610 [Ascosphaera atra]